MPRKKRQPKQDLRRAGFVEDIDPGKGSHTTWVHPRFPDLSIVIAGYDGDDAKEVHMSDAVMRNPGEPSS